MCDFECMTEYASEKLRKLRVQAGYTVRGLAADIGWAAGYHNYESARYKKAFLPATLVKALLPALTARGIPADQIIALGQPDASAYAGGPLDRAVMGEIIRQLVERYGERDGAGVADMALELHDETIRKLADPTQGLADPEVRRGMIANLLGFAARLLDKRR